MLIKYSKYKPPTIKFQLFPIDIYPSIPYHTYIYDDDDDVHDPFQIINVPLKLNRKHVRSVYY